MGSPWNDSKSQCNPLPTEDHKALYLLLGEGWIILDLPGLKLSETHETGKKRQHLN